MIRSSKSYLASSWKPLFAVFVWGLSFIATKRVLEELKPEMIVFVRQLLGISFLFFVVKKQKQNFAINLKDHKWVFILAFIACFHLWIQITGLQWTSASNTGWIIGITPVFMTILALIFFKEKLTKQQFSGIVISFIGLLLLVSKWNLASLDLINNKGDLLIIASSLTWAIYSLASKKATLNYSPVMTTLYLFVIVAIVISPFAVNSKNITDLINLTIGGWIAILFLGVLCSGAAYVLWAQSLSEMSASRVGAYLYIEPFITFFGSWILLNEEITFLMLISGLIIISGVVLVNRK